MRAIQKKSKPLNKFKVVKNKEIIIYKNGEEYKHFIQSDSKELNEDELFVLDYLLKKYSRFEVPLRNSKLTNEYDYMDYSGRKNYEISQTQNFFEEEEDKKTEPKLREFFEDIEDENNQDNEDMVREQVTEIKKLRKGTKTTEEQKVPIQKNRNNNINYRYEDRKIDIEENDDEESEESPQYIIELESYTSPSFKFIDEKKAEYEILNGIKTSIMINGEEKKGLIFLGKNGKVVFISFEDKKETELNLFNIKRIYFNIKGSDNIRNYTKKSNDEIFLQIVELNNKKTDFKFNKNEDLEYFIKGLIRTYRKKISPLDKNIIYQKVNTYSIPYKKQEKRINTIKEKKSNINTLTNRSEKNNVGRNRVTTTKYVDKKVVKKYDNENNNINLSNSNFIQYYTNNYTNTENINNNNNDDDIVTTTITEVYKGDKLINEETKEESGGVVRTLHSYSPDVGEYEEYLRKSQLKKNINNDLNRSIERVKRTNNI